MANYRKILVRDAQIRKMTRKIYHRHIDGIVGSLIQRAKSMLEKVIGLIDSATARAKSTYVGEKASAAADTIKNLSAAKKIIIGALAILNPFVGSTIVAGTAGRAIKQAVLMLGRALPLLAAGVGAVALFGPIIAGIKVVMKLLEKAQSLASSGSGDEA